MIWPSRVLARSARSSRTGAPDLPFECLRQPRPIVISGRREKDLGLVLEAPKRLAMDDPVAVALKRRPDVVFRLLPEAAARFGAPGGLSREDLAFARLELFTQRVHTI